MSDRSWLSYIMVPLSAAVVVMPAGAQMNQELPGLPGLPGAAGAQTDQETLRELRDLRRELRDLREEEFLHSLDQDSQDIERAMDRDDQRQRERQEREQERRGFDCYRLGPFVTCDPR